MTEEVSEPTTEGNGQYEKGLWHGQHSNRFYWILGIILLVGGAIGGYFIGPDEWPLWRKLAAGGMFGIWCGYCVFAWHLLFYDTVES